MSEEEKHGATVHMNVLMKEAWMHTYVVYEH